MSAVPERPATAQPGLPAGVEARPARAEDLEALVDLCIRCDVADLGTPDTDVDDVKALGRRPGYDRERHSVLVVAGDRPVGYGDVFEGEGFGMVDPGWWGRGIGGWLVGRIEELARLAADHPATDAPVPPGGHGGRPGLEVSAPAGDRAYAELVGRAGYRRGRSTWLMRLEMDGPPPLPVWPEGVAVRTFDPGDEEGDVGARAVHRLVQDAFADIGNQPPRSYEFWVEVNMERSDFDPSLWFLAVDGNELVGVNLAYSGPLGGYVAQLAVRRDHRGRGLGLALLRHGFGELYRRGVREVYLHVDSENRTGATRLYEQSGMRVQYRYDHWVKSLR
ncbi:MAG TPA: GNAT family N-acetyltransferase [Actinomycetota bacterium]|nr:GNAT family N-acetyltransferase [Actinomycetota bacterium]